VKLELINAFHWNIKYVVYGYPLPNVTWFKDGSILVQNDVIYDHMTSQGDAVIKGGLIFQMANHFNNGNYTLVASNVHGNSSETISATFLQSPGRLHTAPCHIDQGHEPPQKSPGGMALQSLFIFLPNLLPTPFLQAIYFPLISPYLCNVYTASSDKVKRTYR